MKNSGDTSVAVRWTFLRRLALLGLALNIVAILLLTTTPFAFDLRAAAIAAKWRQVEWIWIYRDSAGRLLLDKDLLQNIVFFSPLGACWAVAFWPRPAWRLLLETFVIGLAFSLLVEGLQLLTPHRVTQLADVWRNTLGAACGGGLAALLTAPTRHARARAAVSVGQELP